ncbi:MAG TPA: glycosyl hydrolase, partial [Gemmatimonadaceae bacterium]|nr:glycosyl hydrolase [Gemmatimonadaceae bacterium]
MRGVSPQVGPLMAALLILPLVPMAANAQRRGGAQGHPDTAERPRPLRFDYVGPQSAGRVSAIAGIPGDTTTYYIGGASGGVWKTTDGARTFTPVFDDEPVQAIGALAVAPSNPKIVWAGTGEAWAIRDADIMGDGVYKSVDGGAHWQHMGLPKTGRIARIIVHPTNPDIVFVCALGQITGTDPHRGVFRTEDGGKTWKHVLFVNDSTGCSGLSMDAHDPNVLFAGTWQVQLNTWTMKSGGPGSGVYVTRDGGTHWARITDPGLPKSPVGKIDVAVAPSDSKRVYALIETPNQGSLWRSDDGGHKWRVVSWDRTLIGRAGYYINVDVNPLNENEVLIASSSFHRSTDGGLTFPLEDRGCGDCHAIWMDPLNPDHWITSGDGGAGITK